MKVICTKKGKWQRLHDTKRWRDLVPFDELPKKGKIYEVESKAKITEDHEVLFLKGYPLAVGFNAKSFKELEPESIGEQQNG